jgi:hypothetical protein
MKLKGIAVTTKNVLDAIAQFNATEKPPVSQKFMIDLDGKQYPPKKILSIATGLPVSGFSGGSGINNGLTKLGFNIVSYNA